MNSLHLTNQRFGKLIAQTPTRKGKAPAWVCLCDCGNTCTVSTYHLREGRTKSCGCYRREMGVLRGTQSKRHGEGSNKKETAEYRCWSAMMSRCRNPNHRLFKHYGARGIYVVDRWHTYENFLQDMDRKPTPHHSIDRIDVHGPYSPENCRWATSVEQNNNKTSTRMITIQGQTKPLQQWLKERNVVQRTFYNRLRAGWSEEQALSECRHLVRFE